MLLSVHAGDYGNLFDANGEEIPFPIEADTESGVVLEYHWTRNAAGAPEVSREFDSAGDIKRRKVRYPAPLRFERNTKKHDRLGRTTPGTSTDEECRRLGIFEVSHELLAAILKLPPNAKIIGLGKTSSWETTELYVESPDLPQIAEGSGPTRLRPLMSSANGDMRTAQFVDWGLPDPVVEKPAPQTTEETWRDRSALL